MFTVGIDLGTTASAISCVIDGKPQVIKIDGNSTVPSVVNYSESSPIVGREAVYNHGSDQTIFSVKRFMGSDKLFCGKNASEVSADILLHLKTNAERILNKTIDSAVITVPAHFSDAQRTATKLAASIAGIKVLRLINEPTAASIAFGLDKQKNGLFAIYDFGGGTFDFSILRLEDGIFQVLSTGGSNHLGGDDVDNEILRSNVERLNLKELSSDQNNAYKLVAKSLKENIGKSENFSKDISIGCKNYQFSLTQDELKQFSQKLIDRSLEIAAQAIEDANISVKDLDGVVLVGGMTRLSLIRDAVAKFFNTKIYDDLNPEEVVSLGAALQAQAIADKNNNLLLIDVVPLTLGIETFGGGVDKIIHRNTPIPISERREYTTYQDNQGGIKFRVVQGERPIATECQTLADFELTGIPAMPAGRPRIIVDFSVDINGILHVTATEKTTGIKQSVTASANSEISQEKMLEILQKAYQSKDQDESFAKQIAIQTETERSIRFWKSIVDELPADIIDSTKEKISNIEKMMDAKYFDQVLSKKNELENIFGKHLDEIINNHLSGKKLSDIRRR